MNITRIFFFEAKEKRVHFNPMAPSKDVCVPSEIIR